MSDEFKLALIDINHEEATLQFLAFSWLQLIIPLTHILGV